MPSVSNNKSRTVVRIPCEVTNGAFSSEHLITIETANGLITGFIQVDDVIEGTAGEHFVDGIVQGKKDGKIVVRLPGSFFTTTGIAYFLPQQVSERAL